MSGGARNLSDAIQRLAETLWADEECSCGVTLHFRYEAGRVVAQHGENPEHVTFLNYRVDAWDDEFQTWLDAIHAHEGPLGWTADGGGDE